MWSSKNIVIPGLMMIFILSQLQIAFSHHTAMISSDVTPIQHKENAKMQTFIHSTVPAATMFLFLVPAPLGPILAIGSSILYTIYCMRSTDLSSDFLHQTTMIGRMKRMEEHLTQESEKIVDKMTYVVDGHALLRELRLTLGSFDQYYYDNIECVLDKNCTAEIRDDIVADLIKPSSQYRIDLQNFVMKFINTREHSNSQGLHRDKSIYDFMLMANTQRAMGNKNCYNRNYVESDHSRLFKSFLHISTVLTNFYSMVAAAHLVRHVEFSNKNHTSAANDWLEKAKEITDKYLVTMQKIVSVTKWAINKSSRDIRMCDPANSERGVSYEPLKGFIRAQLVISENKDILRNYHYWSEKNYLYKKCEPSNLGEESLSTNNLELFDCHIMPQDIFDVYIDPMNKERTYDYFTRSESNTHSGRYGQILQTFGSRSKKELHHIRLSKLVVCSVTLCYAYQNRQVENTLRSFSTKPVEASPGFVVTGIRWRITNHVVYMDIQEGRFIHATSVDPETVVWKETPEDNENILILDVNQRSIALDDAILPAGSYLTGVQLVVVDGKMTLSVRGLEADDTGTQLLNESIHANVSNVLEMEELMLDHPDLPERAPKNQENVVRSTPGKHYVRFQPTDLEKDAAQTTVPYLDIQEVATNPPAPVGGIGIYYKGDPDFGGFLGLKIVSVDLETFINIDSFKSAIENYRSSTLKKIRSNSVKKELFQQNEEESVSERIAAF